MFSRGDGKSGEYLRELGFQVIHEAIDFFENDLGDILISNPPYAKKKEVFSRLKELNKPYPTTVLHTKYFKDTFKRHSRCAATTCAIRHRLQPYVCLPALFPRVVHPS